MNRKLLIITLLVLSAFYGFSQSKFSGLEMNLGNLYRTSDAKTRSISPENFTGEKGKGGMANPADKDKSNIATGANAARDLGQGWKVNPSIDIRPGQTFTLAEMEGPRCHPAHLDDPYRQLAVLYTPHLLGRRKRAFRRVSSR